jgi:hypothetical protein
LSKFKIGIGGLVAALLVAFGAFGLGATTQTAEADITAVFLSLVPFEQLQSEDFTDAGSCSDMPLAFAVTDLTGNAALPGGVILAICVDLDQDQGDDGTDSADLTFDSNDVGEFLTAVCANTDGDGDWFELDFPFGINGEDECVSTEGIGTDELHVDCAEQPGTPPCDNESITVGASNDPGGVLVLWECSDEFAETTITIVSSDAEAGSPNDVVQFDVECLGEVDELTITARPTTVEIVPARSNTSHSFIDVLLEDEDGNPVASGIEVDFTTNRCSIETEGVDTSSERTAASLQVLGLSTANTASYVAWEFGNPADEPVDAGLPTLTRQSDSADSFQTTTGTRASAILGCNPVDAPGATPGVATVTACVEVTGPDICVSVDVTVIGPPASITVAASPTSVRCGEKSTITATVKDSIGQNVSDHTRVEMITNLGGVIAGQGAVAGFAGPVVPISSSVGDTFGGVATAFLLTSESHSGPYEVVATTGGTAAFDPLVPGSIDFFGNLSTDDLNLIESIPGLNVLGGIFSTPPISAQVTVTCNIPAPTAAPAPTVTAPRTGTGIVPPSTGDAGLASSSSSWTLFAIGGLAAFALAGLATFRFARR